jgi:hypothetical protein
VPAPVDAPFVSLARFVGTHDAYASRRIDADRARIPGWLRATPRLRRLRRYWRREVDKRETAEKCDQRNGAEFHRRTPLRESADQSTHRLQIPIGVLFWISFHDKTGVTMVAVHGHCRSGSRQ